MESSAVSVNKKSKVLSREQLESMNQQELINRITQLEAHNSQLKNVIHKKTHTDDSAESGECAGEHRRQKRKFDFSKSHKRHVLLRFLYFGWDYQGFACQEDSTDTIEYHLFNALQKTCLIESRETSNYNRCGRTDKGVSAFGQVISIDLRSKFSESEQMKTENIQTEIDYCTMLNRVLPKDIRCVAWMPLNNKSYSARFDCIQRTYRYFFPKGNLNITLNSNQIIFLQNMEQACQYLIGLHDFRNLCKMDVNNGVTNFKRRILSAKIISSCAPTDSDAGYNMYYLEIVGQAFLWHQIRCIMAVLLQIGQENEDPEVVKELLDVETNPCKPQYSLASALPLNLYSCEFKEKSGEKSTNLDEDSIRETCDSDTTEWQYSKDNLTKLIDDLQQSWSLYNTKVTMVREVLNSIKGVYDENFESKRFESQANFLQEGGKPKVYQKLLARKRCESLENRIEHYVKKQRLIVEDKSIETKS